MTWFDEPLSTFRTPNQLPVSTGSWFEQREAARFSLYTWSEFRALSAYDQSGVVAYYRTYNKLHALIDQYQTQQIDLRTSKAVAGRGGRK